MTNKKTKIIFSIYMASELMAEGHTVLRTMPNPARPDLMAWEFEVDETFDEDFNKLRRKE